MPKKIFRNGNKPLGVVGDQFTAEHGNQINIHRHDGIDEDFHGVLDYYTAGGTANALTVTCKPPLTSHIPGMPIYIKITATNTGSAVTLNVDGLGSKAVKKGGGVDLAPGDLQSGDIIAVAYEANADCCVLLGGRALLQASSTQAGILKLATTSQAQAGSDDAAALTALKLAQAFSSNQSLGGNGYQKFPGGLILQWGVLSPSNLGGGGSVMISFPIAFPAAVFATVVTDGSGVAVGGISPACAYSAIAISPAQFSLQNQTTITKNEYVQWIALGK